MSKNIIRIILYINIYVTKAFYKIGPLIKNKRYNQDYFVLIKINYYFLLSLFLTIFILK